MSQFKIPKEIKTKPKILGLEFKELIVALLMIVLSLTFFKEMIHQYFVIPYFIVIAILVIYLFAPSDSNPLKKNYQALYLFGKRKNAPSSYQAIDIHKASNALLYQEIEEQNQEVISRYLERQQQGLEGVHVAIREEYEEHIDSKEEVKEKEDAIEQLSEMAKSTEEIEGLQGKEVEEFNHTREKVEESETHSLIDSILSSVVPDKKEKVVATDLLQESSSTDFVTELALQRPTHQLVDEIIGDVESQFPTEQSVSEEKTSLDSEELKSEAIEVVVDDVQQQEEEKYEDDRISVASAVVIPTKNRERKFVVQGVLEKFYFVTFGVLITFFIAMGVLFGQSYFNDMKSANHVQLVEKNEELVQAIRHATMKEYKEAAALFDQLNYKELKQEDQDIMLLTYLFNEEAEKAYQLEPRFDETIASYYRANREEEKIKELNQVIESEVLRFEVAVMEEDYTTILKLKEKVKMNEQRVLAVANALIQSNKKEDAVSFVKEHGQENLLEKIESEVQ